MQILILQLLRTSPYRNTFNVKVFFVLVIALSLSNIPCLTAQQATVEQIENTYKDLFGLNRLIALNKLSDYYSKENTRKALRYGRQAVALSEKIFVETNTSVDFDERQHQAHAYVLLGKVLYQRENYFDAKENLEVANSLSAEIGHESYATESNLYLQKIQELIDSGKIKESLFSRTLGDLKVGAAISNTKENLAIQTAIKLGKGRENKGDYQGAINHYEKVINLMKNKGNSERMKEFQLKIAGLLDSLNNHVQAQKFLNETLLDIEKNRAENESNGAIDTVGIENLTGEYSTELLREEREKVKTLAKSFATKKEYEKAIAYERMYYELSIKIEKDSLNSLMDNYQTKNEILLLKQQKRIADLNVDVIEKEKEKQVKFRNIFVFVALLILLSTLITLYFYRIKKRQHKKLTITHTDLKKTQSKLVTAEHKIVSLLKQQLSGDIAEELLLASTDKKGKKCFVCIMFLDIRDFTVMAEKMSPEELIAYQNEIFGFMIDAIQDYHGNVNQLMGDGFMATFGAPVSHGNDCQNAFSAANKILAELKDRCDAKMIPKTRIGIGLHAGYVVTGNVGNESRKQYSVTGNPVIIASRAEQLNKEFKSQLIITEQVFERLEDKATIKEPFTKVNVKGRTEPIKILKFY